jgi:hypothetical protein
MSLNTKADYLLFFGKNLEIELANFPCDVEGQKAEIFINNIEDFCKSYLMKNYDWDGVFLNKFQENQFKKGCLFQIEYVLHNSDLFNDSGVDADKGVIVSEDVLRKVELSTRAFNEFWLGGMANMSRLGRV